MSNSRRLYLRVTLKLLILIGLGLATIPFIASLQHGGGDATQSRNPWFVDVDLSALQAGQLHSVAWPGGEVWIHHRTLQDIEYLHALAPDRLRDPASAHSEQPAPLRHASRSFQPEYFVFLPRESRRGCQVQHIELQTGITGYTEACFGARFDNAGRIFKDSGQAEQQNLVVPPHQFTGPTSLRLLPKEK